MSEENDKAEEQRRIEWSKQRPSCWVCGVFVLPPEEISYQPLRCPECKEKLEKKEN